MTLPPTPLGLRFFERILRPGDHLLYTSSSLWSRLIRVKTWSPYSHIEVYLGDGKSFSAREREGVGIFPLRTDGLRLVLRPTEEWDPLAARRWAASVRGQRYDFWGLLRFFTLGAGRPDRMFCSEACLRLDRMAGFHPCHVRVDADTVAPGEFPKMRPFDHYWERR